MKNLICIIYDYQQSQKLMLAPVPENLNESQIQDFGRSLKEEVDLEHPTMPHTPNIIRFKDDTGIYSSHFNKIVTYV